MNAVRLGAAGLVVAAIIVQARVLADAGAFDPTRFFAYFTIQSNLIGVAAVVWAAARAGARRSRALELVRGGAAVYLTITFFVVIFLLTGIDVGLQLPWVDFVLHKLFPVVVVADWLLDPPRVRLRARDALVWLGFPIVWIVVTLLRGAGDGWYPYPFLNPANGGYGQVAITLVAITVGFLVVAAVILVAGNARRTTGPEAVPAT
jgi:hypothetical protein